MGFDPSHDAKQPKDTLQDLGQVQRGQAASPTPQRFPASQRQCGLANSCLATKPVLASLLQWGHSVNRGVVSRSFELPSPVACVGRGQSASGPRSF